MRHTGWRSARTVFMSQPAAPSAVCIHEQQAVVPVCSRATYQQLIVLRRTVCSVCTCTLCLQLLRYGTCTRFLCSSLRRETRIGGRSSVLPSPWLFLRTGVAVVPRPWSSRVRASKALVLVLCCRRVDQSITLMLSPCAAAV